MENVIAFNNAMLVSVVISCYNSAEFRRAFKSVCKQSCICWEVICVDDYFGDIN